MDCYSGYIEKQAKTIKYIERRLIKFIEDKYILQEWEIPALISGEVIKKCGYLKTMPNQLTVVGALAPNAIENSIKDEEIKDEDIEYKNYYLTPAACIHLYPMIEKNPIYNTIITTRARVYRYEAGKFETGRRLWDFGVREFVAVGDREYVRGFLTYFQEKSLEFTGSCKIDCHIENSNDHFYPTKSNSTIQKMQKVNGLKRELVHTETNLALASYNYHELHFSKLFNFDNNKQVVTGCVGFGLDRWVSVLDAKRGEIR